MPAGRSKSLVYSLYRYCRAIGGLVFHPEAVVHTAGAFSPEILTIRLSTMHWRKEQELRRCMSKTILGTTSQLLLCFAAGLVADRCIPRGTQHGFPAGTQDGLGAN